MGDYLLRSNYLSEKEHGFRGEEFMCNEQIDFYEKGSSVLGTSEEWVDCACLNC